MIHLYRLLSIATLYFIDAPSLLDLGIELALVLSLEVVLLWYFLKRLLQVHVHGSGEIKRFQGLYINYCYFALNLLIMVHEIVMYRR